MTGLFASMENNLDTSVASWLNQNEAVSKSFGVPVISYEGRPDLPQREHQPGTTGPERSGHVHSVQEPDRTVGSDHRHPVSRSTRSLTATGDCCRRSPQPAQKNGTR